ncbi:MAG: esterase, partial [Acidimicrobiales bacterium]
MAYDLAGDVRLDPRIKALLAAVPSMDAGDADSREAMLAEANTPQALRATEEFRQLMELCDTEELAPS